MTGIIASLTGSASVSYTPASDAKVAIAGCPNSGGYVSVNGVAIAYFYSPGLSAFNSYFYVAAGVPFTVAVATGATCIVSILES